MKKNIKKLNNIKKRALLSLIFAVSMSLIPTIAPEAKEGDISAQEVIKLVNKSREEAGIPALIQNPKLEAAAKEKAKDMIVKNYFAHISPEGTSPWDLIIAEGYDYKLAGENLAIDYTNAKDQHKAWMESPLHRKNILNSEYGEIGVASIEGTFDGRKTIVTVQEFGMQMTRVAPAVNVGSIKQPSSAVAGVSDIITENEVKRPLEIPASLNTSKQFEKKTIIENDRLTVFGWLGVIIVTSLFTVVDIAALIYRKYKNSLIYLK